MDLEKLIKIARRNMPADIVLKNCRVPNLLTKQTSLVDVAISDSSIAGLGFYEGKEEIDIEGAYLLPGFIDAHIHIESSHLRPEEFCRAALKRGTTTVIADPHEIVNVCGSDGLRYFLDATEDLPLKFYFMLPSCIAATNMETSGSVFDLDAMREFVGHKRVLGLGEVMNTAAVINEQPDLMAKLRMFADGIIDGHAPCIGGFDLQAYAAAGMTSDHESSTIEEALEKIKAGLTIAIRDGSTTQDLDNCAGLFDLPAGAEALIVSDDRDPEDLAFKGHMDESLRKAVSFGVDPLAAIRAVTLNPARHYGLRHLGAIFPGYSADLVVVEDLSGFRVKMTFTQGNMVFYHDDHEWTPRYHNVPLRLLDTINLPRVDHTAFTIPARGDRIRVIVYRHDSLRTDSKIINANLVDGSIAADPQNDVIKVAVLERYSGLGGAAVGFLKGFGLRSGALASTVAHDAHNMIVVGTNDSDMAAAVNRLIDIKGGQVVINGGEIKAECAMPLAGLMSMSSYEEVAAQKQRLHKEAANLGAVFEKNPFMALSFLSLSVVPELKITDHGLIDVASQSQVPLFQS